MSICVCSGLWARVVSRCLISVVLYENGMAVEVDFLGKQKEGLLKPKIEYFKVTLLFFTFIFYIPLALPLFVQTSTVWSHHDQWWSQYTVYLSKTEHF